MRMQIGRVSHHTDEALPAPAFLMVIRPRPSVDYNPMKKPGGLLLGMGGDTSPGGVGTFYEGVVTKGYSSDAADDAVQANIVAARYARRPRPRLTPWPAFPVFSGVHGR